MSDTQPQLDGASPFYGLARFVESGFYFLPPTGLRRLAGERFGRTKNVPWVKPPFTVELDDLIARMTGVDSVDQVGTNGMAIASRAMESDVEGEGRYEAEFGRDALYMAKFGDERFPLLTQTTVRRLAEVQGREDRPGTDTQKLGQIPHEIRQKGDKMREFMTAEHGWEWPYFGSIDATALFVSAAMRAERRQPGFLKDTVRQSDGVVRPLAEIVGDSVQWILMRMDQSPDGLIETEMASNKCWQVWADSPDAYHHRQGRLAEGKLAPVEVQAYAYDALMDVSDYLRFSRHDVSDVLKNRAKSLRSAVVKNFWVKDPDDGSEFLAYAVERRPGHKIKPLKLRHINMALTLNTRLFEGRAMIHYATEIVKQVSDPTYGLMKPSGIATLDVRSPRFRPQGYHDGSIWDWTNYEVAAGLLRHDQPLISAIVLGKSADAIQTLNCYPENRQGNDAPQAQMNEAIVKSLGPTGGGGMFSSETMQPGQRFQGWTAFGKDFADRVIAQMESGVLPCQAQTADGRRLERELVIALQHAGHDLPPEAFPYIANGGPAATLSIGDGFAS